MCKALKRDIRDHPRQVRWYRRPRQSCLRAEARTEGQQLLGRASPATRLREEVGAIHPEASDLLQEAVAVAVRGAFGITFSVKKNEKPDHRPYPPRGLTYAPRNAPCSGYGNHAL